MKAKGRLYYFAVILITVIGVSFFTSRTAYGLHYEKPTIEVDPNPYHQTAEATVTCSISHNFWQHHGRPVWVLRFTLWEDDDGDRWKRAGDDLIDEGLLFLNVPSKFEMAYNLTCDAYDKIIVDQYNTRENPAQLVVQVEYIDKKTWESGGIFVPPSEILEVKQLECDIPRIQPRPAETPPPPAIPGKPVDIEINIEAPVVGSVPDSVENVKTVDFGVTYNNAFFQVDSAYFAPSLASSQVSISDSVIFFYADLPTPITVADSVARIHFSVNEDAPIMKTTPLEFTPESAFYDSTAQPCSLSFWPNCTILILPPDTLFAPAIYDSLIFVSQYEVRGSPGSVTDDWDSLSNYIQVELYDYQDSLVRFATVDSIGGFGMEHFWLTSGTTAKLTARDALDNYDQFLFTVPISYIPDIVAGPDTSGPPGDTVQVSFNLFNRCDSTETYDVHASSALGWYLYPQYFNPTLGSFADTMLYIDVHIPTLKEDAPVDTITLIAISTTDTASSDTASLSVAVTTAPERVVDLTITLAMEDLVLVWSPVTVDTNGTPLVVDQYRIYRDTVAYFPPGSPPFDTTVDTFYVDTSGVVGNTGTHYYYAVTAVSAGKESEFSNQVGEFDRGTTNMK